MKSNWIPAFAGMTLSAVAALTAAQAGVPNDSPFEHKTIPGASPEPITEGAGLKGKEDLEAFFDGVMAAHLKAQRIAGATVAVVKDGAVFFTKGYGYADLDQQTPVDPAVHLFRPGSVTKLFTWTAVMQLVEQNKLDLDKDVNAYITQFQIPATFPQPITLRNLLTHTAGFEDGGIGYLFVKTAQESAPLADFLKTHMPARVRPPTTDFSNGMGSSYSNWGTGLAGLIVENVSGLSFDEYQEKFILGPLGMTHSSFREPLPPELHKNMSAGYKQDKGRRKLGEFEYIHHCGPAGDLSSTATDMANFMIAHLQNGRFGNARILREETARMMHTRQLSPSPYVSGTGLGFYETWINGRRWIGHAGDTVYFHTNLALLKEENLGIYVSYNSGAALPFSQREDLVKAFADRYFPARLPVVTPPADFKERAAKFAGNYRVIRHSYTKNERLFGLLGIVSVAPTKDNTLLIASLGGAPPNQWVEVAPSTFRRLDAEEVISFPEDANGQVTGFVWPFPFHAVYKLKWYDTLQWHGFVIGLGVLCFVIALVSVVRNWKSDRSAVAGARQARRLAALLGLCNLMFLILLGVTFAKDIDQLLYGWPAVFKVALAFPLLAIPLTLGVAWFAVRAWKDGFWTRYGRVQYTVIALASIGFLWSLNFLNLVGYKFG